MAPPASIAHPQRSWVKPVNCQAVPHPRAPGRDVALVAVHNAASALHPRCETAFKPPRSESAVLGQRSCFIAAAIALACPPSGRGEHGGGSVMELRTASPRKYAQARLLNHCAQCGETIFLPEWSEYLDRHRVRHLWECEACGYKFETLVTFPDL